MRAARCGAVRSGAERIRALPAVLEAVLPLSAVLQGAAHPGPARPPQPPAAAAGPCTPAMEARAAGSAGTGYNEALLHKVGLRARRSCQVRGGGRWGGVTVIAGAGDRFNFSG